MKEKEEEFMDEIILGNRKEIDYDSRSSNA